MGTSAAARPMCASDRRSTTLRRPWRLEPMYSTELLAWSRRDFLKSTAVAGVGLLIGVHVPRFARAQSGAAAVIQGDGAAQAPFAPNAFVRIAPDNTVTVLVKHIEFGQGPYTGLATLVAEELDADWSQMRAEAAPANAEFYTNSAFGIQGTGGSLSLIHISEPTRRTPISYA